MTLNNAGLDAILNDGNEAVVWAALGDGPLATDQTSNERIQLTLGTPTDGIITVTNVPLAFTGTPSAGATHVLLFTAQTGGTFLGSETLIGDQAYNATGDYEVTSLTITATAI